MKNLILKEISSNKKNIFLSVILSLVAIVLLAFDKNDYSVMGFYISCLTCFTYFIGKSCYIDEHGSTLDYLKTLPTSTSNIVNTKFILTLATILQGWILVYIGSHLLKIIGKSNYNLNHRLIVPILCIHLLYCGIYLFLFFRFKYSATQYSYIIVFILLLLTKMIGSKKYFDINSIDLSFLPYMFMLVALIAFITFWRLSINAFDRRNN